MIILGIDTATIAVGAAIRRDNVLLASHTSRPGRHHVETLHPVIEAVLFSAGVALHEVDAIAVDIGPGLFTGLRVGIAAAKGFAFALSVPIVAVKSTEALRDAVTFSPHPVVPVIDMRRGDVAFEMPTASEADDRAVILGPPELLAEQLATLSGEVLLVGDGAERYADKLAGVRGPTLHFAGVDFAAPSVDALTKRAMTMLVAGDVTDPYALTPLYLRQADVRINFATRAPVVPKEVAS